jgi:hypothetical protein
MAVLNTLAEVTRSVSVPQIVTCIPIIYIAGLTVYRLYFSPIARFPGPKLAALTQWYEIYWNVYKTGQFTFHLQDLHDRYGMLFLEAALIPLDFKLIADSRYCH